MAAARATQHDSKAKKSQPRTGGRLARVIGIALLDIALLVLALISCTDAEPSAVSPTAVSPTAVSPTAVSPTAVSPTDGPESQTGESTTASPTPEPEIPKPEITAAPPGPGGVELPEPARFGTYVVAKPSAGSEIELIPGEPARREIAVYDRPGGEPRTLLDHNQIDAVDLPLPLIDFDDPGGPLVLRVIAGGPEDDWLVVQAPTRPNNSYAWVHRSDFDFGFTSKRIEVDLAGEGELQVVDGEKVLLRSAIVQGRDERETPTGVSYLAAGVSGELIGQAFGHAVLATAGFSEDLGTFGGGGLPRTLLHGTNAPELMGERISSGNIRLPDEQLEALIELVTPGTPILVFDSSDARPGRAEVLARAPQQASTTEFVPGIAGAADPLTGVAPQLWERCESAADEQLLCASNGIAEVVNAGNEFEHVYATAKLDAGMWFAGEPRVIPVYDEPNGPPQSLVYENDVDNLEYDYPLRPTTVFGEPLVLSVVKMTTDGNWLLVRAPVLPHNRVVWVSADDFDLATSTIRIEVDIGYELLDEQGILTVWDGPTELLSAKISSGRESRPTTLTSTYVDQLIPGGDLSEAYGPFILSTPTFSETLGTFGGGGLPQQSIHGVDSERGANLGMPASSGSIHVSYETITRMAEIDGIVGARVVIYDSSAPLTDVDAIADRGVHAADTKDVFPGTVEQPIGAFT